MPATIFDVRSLETTDLTAKVNFEFAKLEQYKKQFITAIADAEAITLTGAGPAWLHCALFHEAHGRIPDGAIVFEAPGVRYAPAAAGEATGQNTEIVDDKIVVDIGTLETKGPEGRVNFLLDKVNQYQKTVLARVPTFTPGEEFPEFEVVLTGAGPIWLFLALVAALHSRGGKVVYSAPNCPRCVIVDHK